VKSGTGAAGVRVGRWGLLDVEELDIENEDRVGGDGASRGAAGAVPVLRLDGEPRLLPLAQLLDAVIPSTDDAPTADAELEGVPALHGAVELLPVGQLTGVVDDDGVAGLGERHPVPGLQRLDPNELRECLGVRGRRLAPEGVDHKGPEDEHHHDDHRREPQDARAVIPFGGLPLRLAPGWIGRGPSLAPELSHAPGGGGSGRTSFYRETLLLRNSESKSKMRLETHAKRLACFNDIVHC